MLDKKLLKNIDWAFIGLIILIMAVSLVVLKSASKQMLSGEKEYYYVIKQGVWFLLGLGVLVGVATFNYAKLMRLSPFIYVANLGLLLMVLVLGDVAKGAQRWINLGPVAIQPSEFAKIAIIITFASFLTKRQGKLNRLWDLIPCFMHVGIPMLLILKQPDLGTSLVFTAIMMGMLWVGGAKPKIMINIILVAMICAGIIFGALFIATDGFQNPPQELPIPLPLKMYQLTRLIIFVNPQMDPLGAGYHVIQSQVAIGSGGFWGEGYQRGSQVQSNFLPEHHTDFIFSVVGEELGFWGSTSILLLYFLLLSRAVKIASEAKDILGTLLVVGVTSMFAFHVLVNVGMTIGIMPVTGLPLPLFSYGGSSTLANMIALGLIVNVNLRKRKLLF